MKNYNQAEEKKGGKRVKEINFSSFTDFFFFLPNILR